MDFDWLDRARRLQALAQSGLAFTHDAYDRERYETIRAIAAELIAAGVADEAAPISDAAASADAAADVHAAGSARLLEPEQLPDRTRLLEGIFAAQSGYATPKVDVRAAVFREERILLVRERSDGRWTLPGGWADVGDSPRQAVERETLEEAGCAVRAVKLAAVYDRNLHGHTPHLFHIWKLFFLCELVDGAASAAPERQSGAGGRVAGATTASCAETDAVDFFALDALPPLSLGRITAGQIARMFEHHRHPEWAASFD